jgi:hypothetical protein
MKKKGTCGTVCRDFQTLLPPGEEAGREERGPGEAVNSYRLCVGLRLTLAGLLTAPAPLGCLSV